MLEYWLVSSSDTVKYIPGHDDGDVFVNDNGELACDGGSRGRR